MSSLETAAGLPPVVIHTDGMPRYLNTGMDETMIASLVRPQPLPPRQIVPPSLMVLMGFGLVVIGLLEFFGPQLPVRPGLLTLVGMSLVLAAAILGIVAGEAIRRRSYKRAVTGWRAQQESVLLSLSVLARHPQWSVVRDHIDALERGSGYILRRRSGDGHDLSRGRDALVDALERVSQYAKDPNPTTDLRDAARAAVIAFERAAIELAARKGTL